MEKRNFVLWGSSGHAKVLADLIELNGGCVSALFDNDPQATSVIPGVPLFFGEDGFEHWRSKVRVPSDVFALAAIGGQRGSDRLRLQRLFRKAGLKLAPIQHPSASVSDSAIIGAGTQVLAQSIIASGASVGAACIINHRASVDHECTLADGVHIAPGATLCGCIDVGRNALIGAGAVVLPRLSIGANSIVGAGAVVTRNVPDNFIVVGNPARSSTQTR